MGLLLGLWSSWNPARAQAVSPVDRILARLSLEQQVGQLFLVSFRGAALSEPVREYLRRAAPGGVILYRGNTSSPVGVATLVGELNKEVTEASRVGPLVAIDLEGGDVSRFFTDRGFTSFPSPLAVGASGDPQWAERVGRAMAEELSALGIHLNLAPVADLATNPNNALIRRRAFGSDPERVGEMVAAFVRGSQRAGVMACAKHFPGHGATRADSHRELPVLERDLDQLKQRELVPFARAVEAGVGCVMAAHIWVAGLEPVKGRPASLSEPLLSGLLRAQLGFDGLVLTDALDMGAVGEGHSLVEAVRLALEGGADMVAFGSSIPEEEQLATVRAVVQLVKLGRLSRPRIARSVRRVLEAKARYRALTGKRKIRPAQAAGRMKAEAHRQLVRQVYAHAVTLVRDEQGALPVRGGEPALLIHPARFADFARTCARRSKGLRPLSVADSPGPEDLRRAAEAAFQARTVIVLTRDAFRDPAQRELVEELPAERVVLVAMRSPYDLAALPDTAAALAVYDPQPAAQAALCDVLLGDLPPVGVLPISLSKELPVGAGLGGFVGR